LQRIEVLDVVGCVCISIINPKSKIVHIENLLSGIYLLKATDEKGFSQTVKFVKQ
jgi:hypothetical protein